MIQKIRTGEATYNLVECIVGKDFSEYELIARLVVDEYAWYVEFPVWQEIGHYWERVPLEFVNEAAAKQYVTGFAKRAS